MATTANRRLPRAKSGRLSLGILVTEISVKVRILKENPQQAITDVVSLVPAKCLGALIIEADDYITPFVVKSRIGFTSRYPESWEHYLRETLESVLEGILALDYDK